VDAAATGTLTAERLDELITEAARQEARAVYAGTLRRNIAPMLVRAFHKALDAGAADEILSSLRPAFDTAAEAIAAARGLISAEGTAEAVLANGTPETITAWQQLPEQLAVINAVSAVASQFGCRTARFPLVEEYALADNYKLDDRALWCADGQLVSDSHPFGRPDQGHRTSPWFRVPLRLHTVASARDRYRQFAASEFDRIHGGQQAKWIDAAGTMHEQPRPTNPYADPVPAS
jgi:hypothetical protein